MRDNSDLTKLPWRDGRKFAPRVLVCDISGNYLYRVHAEEALAMCQSGSAEPDREGRRINKLVLQRTPSQFARLGPARSSLLARPGQRYTFREKVGGAPDENGVYQWAGAVTFAFSHIHPDDQWAFIPATRV